MQFPTMATSILFAALCGLLAPLCASAQAQTAKKPEDLAGAPIVAARQMAIAGEPFDRKLDKATIRKWMEISSQCTIAEFELFLGSLSPAEKKLVEKIERMPTPIVNRLHFEDLRAVLKNGGLLSFYQEEKRAGGQLKHTTPALEDELYGAYDCVFASVGPPDGSPRYGDVIVRLADDVRENGWATPFSGMHFIYAIRHKDARKMQEMLAAGKALPTEPTNPLSLGFDDRLAFSHYVVTEKDWNKSLAYQAILVHRNAGDAPGSKQIRERFAALLTEDDLHKFWSIFIPAREMNIPPEETAARTPFGYLEGKFDDVLSIDDFTSIEVPPEMLEEARSWPEAKPHLKLIRAKAKSVP